MSFLKKWRKRLRKRALAAAAGREWTGVVLPELRSAEPRRYLTVATVIKNEARHLPEWLEFHRRMGVEHFYLYDNGSTDDTAAVCRAYIEAGLVTLLPWANFSVWSNTQRAAYAHAIANFGPDSRWMGFFDIDEFMFAVGGTSLVAVLQAREHLPVLAVVGINFGTGGNELAPAAGVTRGYRMGVPIEKQRQHRDLMYTKCFIQPPRVAAVPSAHWFRIKNDEACGYTEHGVPLRKPHRSPELLTVDVIRYNHYFTRSREEFERKCKGTDVRGTHPEWTATERRRRRMFELIETLAEEDRSIEHVL